MLIWLMKMLDIYWYHRPVVEQRIRAALSTLDWRTREEVRTRADCLYLELDEWILVLVHEGVVEMRNGILEPVTYRLIGQK
jgi:hypothetical protein